MMRVVLAILIATTTASAGAATVLFDFGSTGYQTAQAGWNNVTYADDTPAAGLTTIVDSAGDTVDGLSLVFTDQFFVGTQPELLGTDSPTGDASGLPTTATEDFFLGHTGEFLGESSNPTGAFKLTGLDPNHTYTFTFFASRVGVGDNRETSYTVTGSTQASGLLQASNNNSEVLVLSGITPDLNDEITVSLAAGPNNTNSRSFYYINALQLDIVPEPSALALYAIGSLIAASSRRRKLIG